MFYERIYLHYVLLVVLPSFSYVAITTDFSFNFFEPFRHWRAYNEYFLSIIDGRLDVPAYAIGMEGQYVDDKAYMYYGALPVLTRLFLFPFVDLREVPTSAFSIALFSIGGLVFLQHALISKYLNKVKTSLDMVAFYSLSAVIWYGSATYLIAQDGQMYNEPFAAALFLINIFIGQLIKDDFLLNDNHSLVPYAILAGLATQARMPTALSLYACTVAFMFVFYIKNARVAKKEHLLLLFGQHLLKQAKPLIILFLFGMSVFLFNYLKFGDAFRFMGLPGHYGYILSGEEGLSARACGGGIPRGELAPFGRIVSNSVFYLVGGWKLHDQLMTVFQTGFVRKGAPNFPIILLWLTPLLTVLFSLFYFSKKASQKGWLILPIVAISFGGIAQLSYWTLAARYAAELWPILGLALVLFFRFVFLSTKFSGQHLKWCFVLSAIITVGYNVFLLTTSKYFIREEVSSIEVYDDPPERVAILSSLNAEKIELRIKQHRENLKANCVVDR